MAPESGAQTHVPLTELRAAGKHGTFVVQVKENRIEDYTYRRNGIDTAGKRLVLLFASSDEAAYVSGRMVMWKQNHCCGCALSEGLAFRNELGGTAAEGAA